MAEGLPIVIDLTSESEVDSRPCKRQRTDESSNEASGRPGDVDTDPTSLDDESATEGGQTPAEYEEQDDTIRRQQMSHIAVPGTAYPRSVHEGYEPLFAPVPEYEALNELQRAPKPAGLTADDQTEYTYFRLDGFSIYRESERVRTEERYEREIVEAEETVQRKQIRGSHAHELLGLHRLQNHRGPERLLFDGILTHGNERRYVQAVPFSTLTVDYGEDNAGMDGCIFIQSQYAKRHHPAVWYQLGNPAQEYARFHDPFVWLAQFTKYFVDYLMLHEGVALQRFRSDFSNHLQEKYAGKDEYDTWLQHAPLPCGRRDFRSTIVANVGFLWKECYSLSSPDHDLSQQPLWGEIDELRLTAIPRQQEMKKHTVVTPYAYEAFKHMYFADRLESTIPDPSISRQMAHRKLELGLTPLGTASTAFPATTATAGHAPIEVQPGDVVAVLPDNAGLWKSRAIVWYAYVQNIIVKPGKTTTLHVLWLYDPSDTTIGSATYPFQNELFLSDNCDNIKLSDVTGKAEVAWFIRDPAAAPPAGFFVRQKFRTVHEDDTNDFVSLRQSDFACKCETRHAPYNECVQKFSVNDTVLVRRYNAELGKDSLAPAQILEFDPVARRITVRWFVKKNITSPHARPNELTFTHEVATVSPSRIIRACQLRISHGNDLPTLYDRDGEGDFYFIQVDNEEHLSQLLQSPNDTTAPSVTKPTDGIDVSAPHDQPKLLGMGIFCGGGSFDRGLEDGGAVEFKYAIDWAERALHTYRANARDPEEIKYWLGSINDYFAQALAGEHNALIAEPGQVGLLSAGSPCPAFSLLQKDKFSEKSLTMASMVASVVSFVDLYCPKYCILENVVAMSNSGGPNKDENVFRQIISALVAMGYQVQQFLMEAWNYGSPQSRSRLFIVASAPGSDPFLEPPHTHQHPPTMHRSSRALGRSTNGLAFGRRKMHDEYQPPFPHVSPLQATADLSDIADGQAQLCPQFPDHRTPCELDSQLRACIALVPVRPSGMGIVQAHRQGLVPPNSEPWKYVQRLLTSKRRQGARSRTCARMACDELFSTITTAFHVHDGSNMKCVHWSQHRMITVMEVRRAQGFLDDEVIIGSPAQQVKIIGNSVDRKVSLALGLALRQSWLKSAATAGGGPHQEGDAQEVDPGTRHGDVDLDENQSIEDVASDTSTTSTRREAVLDDEKGQEQRDSTKHGIDHKNGSFQNVIEHACEQSLQSDRDSVEPASHDNERAADCYDLERGGWEDEATYGVDMPETFGSPHVSKADIQQTDRHAESRSTYDLERGSWEDLAVYGIDEPTLSKGSESPVQRRRPLRLSDAQKEDIRTNGFKAIARMIPELSSSAIL